MTRVAELPSSEKPREKLIARGAGALSDAELLAVLLRTGRAGEGVLELAQRWLDDVGGLHRLASLDPEQLVRRPGVGPAKGLVLAAALELGRRLARRDLAAQPVYERPEAVARWVLRAFGRESVEVFGCLTLDSRNRLVREHVLHRGLRDQAAVEPAMVFKAAIADDAHAVILWHTHPSGDPTPSADDEELTRRLAEAGALLRIRVLDHVVVGQGGWVSLRERGIVPHA
jgi:DNA repair protein RadC